MEKETSSSYGWRRLLKRLIDTPAEKQRAADHLSVQKWTLTRWADGKANPRPGYLRLLPDVFPRQKAQLLALMREEFPDISFETSFREEDTAKEIPSAFYARLLHSRAHDQYFPTEAARDLGILQFAGQIDPERRGIHVQLFTFSPSRKSLYEIVGALRHHLYSTNRFAGLETLAGQVVLSGEKSIICSDLQIVALLQRQRLCAGCLVSTCTLPEQVNRVRIELSALYADLLALSAFPEAAFVDPKEIRLARFQQAELQQTLLSATPLPRTSSTIEQMELLLLNAMQ